MNRRFDFRIWHEKEKEMQYFPLVGAKGIYTGYEPIMECLQVTDKNTAFIYEGDIVSYPGETQDYLALVVWYRVNAGFGRQPLSGLSTYQGGDWAEYTIIGNIYEHPHLLEVKENG